jgi:hypothetical protein
MAGMGTESFDDHLTVRAARDAYFAATGFSPAAYTDRWVFLKAGPLRLPLPNTPSRQRAVPLHDLHHVATGYGVDLAGEGEIAAWELAGGCGRHWAAWVLNGGAVAIGLAIAPRRTLRAFRRGRRSRTLYDRSYGEDLLELTVGELRRRLGL